jgi:hypothetical protein
VAPGASVTAVAGEVSTGHGVGVGNSGATSIVGAGVRDDVGIATAVFVAAGGLTTIVAVALAPSG